MMMQRSVTKLPFSPPCLSCHWFVEPKNSDNLSNWKIFAVRFIASPKPFIAEHLEPTNFITNLEHNGNDHQNSCSLGSTERNDNATKTQAAVEPLHNWCKCDIWTLIGVHLYLTGEETSTVNVPLQQFMRECCYLHCIHVFHKIENMQDNATFFGHTKHHIMFHEIFIAEASKTMEITTPHIL